MDVTPDDLATYLGASTVEQERAKLLLELAVEACEEIVNPLPDKARGIVLDVAAAAYVSTPGPGGQQTAGPFTAPMAPGGVTLSPRQTTRLRRLRGRRRGGFSVDPMPRGRTPRQRDLGLSDFYLAGDPALGGPDDPDADLDEVRR